MKNKKVALIILDGWGIGDQSSSDAVYKAHTPVMDKLQKDFPCSMLKTSGLDVGLPEGQMGNSEVGHLNIGAGRVIYQELVKINMAISRNELENNSALKQCFEYVKKEGKRLHFMGLLSNGCIHSSEKHLYHLIELAEKSGVSEYFVHAFTDGRDTDPRSGKGFIRELISFLVGKRGKLASIIGRYYAMDRDKRWERIKIAWDMLVKRVGKITAEPLEEIEKRYEAGETDEFLKPIIVSDVNGTILPGDAVICFNYRTDRCREITQVLTQSDMPEHGMNAIPLFYATMTSYDESFHNIHVIFPREDMKDTLGEIIANQGKSQLRIAETEKYPHVTFFFSGGREKPFEKESRIMVPSPKVATYDIKPEMSAQEVSDAVIAAIHQDLPDFICLNFANPDMVGHTGVFSAITKAVETVDSCLGKVLDALVENHYNILVTADHGNADYAVNPDGSPNTAHTTNPVPCILVNSDYQTIGNGRLADIAPTILHLMDIPVPPAMTGNNLLDI